MTQSRWLGRAVALVVLAAVLAVTAVFVVPLYARSRIEQALGPHAHVDAFVLETAQLVLTGVRIDKPHAHWPAETQLRVARATVDLSITDLLAAPRSIPKLTLTGLHLVITRSTDGSVHALPDLAERPQGETGVQLRIETLELRDVTIELIDEALQQRVLIEHGALSTKSRELDLARFAPYWSETGLSAQVGLPVAAALGVSVTDVAHVVGERGLRELD